MKVAEIINVIENIAPLSIQAEWDASGVQVAALRQTAAHVAVLLDPSLPGLEKAVQLGADFILAHHPLSMKPRCPNRAGEYLSILSLLFSRNIWLYSAHTSLDASHEGTVRWLGEELALKGMGLLEPGTDVAHGFGFVGDLPEAAAYADFCRRLAPALGRAQWRVAGPCPESVHRVACCPGSGGSMIANAVALGADVFITGDLKHHAALEAWAQGLRVLDVGHFILEEEMMRRLSLRLQTILPVPVTFVPGTDPLVVESVEKLRS